ncbi:MAG: methylenetetrahydrofolate--tRNA-(uracil(54)-C(5))-methyltransferase (FADH(2)-oxidizing) TrmFO [Proteobacteria bacterium]|nr:methylenetetrahydrofolate--tRNA-(uracil(54)-C(5))-methyltransferase (FADH(2)-oxidizing) TrmFO [Pseudomonadota bacterium]
MSRVLVIGAGLAGSEAAWLLATRGVSVVLAEVKTLKLNPAQKISTFAELVCTNSLKSMDPDSAHGLLKTEMRALGSLVLDVANATAVPAGDALAVDREHFSQQITHRLSHHPLIQVIAFEASDPIALMQEHNCQHVIVASGPLTTNPLETWLTENLSSEDIYFYDAIAPVVDADTLDYSKLYYKDRHKQPDERADYLNAPMNKEQYDAFIAEMVAAEKVPPKDFEDWKFFESCLPIDLMAERGPETARFSCMKPIGLELPDGSEPWAVVQLRKENLQGAAFNLVGFQTRLTYKEQVRVFRMIPGFEEASFIHLGSCHRNSFLNSRKLLNSSMTSLKFPQMSFAGQITGVEGYTESAAMGLYVAHQLWRRLQGLEELAWPKETGIGALVNYVMTIEKPAPSNINFGLLPNIEMTREQRKSGPKKKVRKQLAAQRAREVFSGFSQQL